MRQKILEARIEFDNDNKLSRITVLVEMSKGDVRAIFATTKPANGYIHLDRLDNISMLNDKLLQRVADYGMETVDRDQIFPNWKKKVVG